MRSRTVPAVAVPAALLAAVPAGPARAETAIVPAGSTWKYLDDGSDQGTAWRDPLFPDSTWSEGPAQLGYGEGDEATEVGYGPDPQDRYITTYFRHSFTVADPSPFLGMTLRLLRDDGAIVYLNGNELERSNMPGDPIDYQTLASGGVGGANESTWFASTEDPLGLVPGVNVLAVEVHQWDPTSSDLSFDLELAVETDLLVNRGPYLQRGADDRVTVCWRTNGASDGRVWWGDAPGNLTSFVDGATGVNDHAVEITGLAPETTYSYAVGTPAGVLAGDDVDHFFVTSPPTGGCEPTRVWVIGDSGTANASAAAVYGAYLAATGTAHTDAWLMLGDNAYPDGTDSEYQNAVFDMYPELLRRTILWSTLGNHDARSADSPTETGVYYDIFTLPRAAEAGGWISGTEAYYSFDHGNVHFICLDSHDTSRSAAGAMMTWLQADLADTLADWIVAFWHHPPYSKGSHDSDDPGDSGGRLQDMREIFLPVLELGGVDLVLTGHSHNYERSYLIDQAYGYNGGVSTPDFATLLADGRILDAGDGQAGGTGAYGKAGSGPNPNQGAVYVVAGTSGATSSGTVDHPVMHVGLNVLGSMILEFDGADRLDATFLQSTGAVGDTFTIVKGTGEIPGDVDGSLAVDVTDLLAVLAAWGPCLGCPEDVDDTCDVDVADLLEVLANWS
jgi:hypothetical protein